MCWNIKEFREWWDKYAYLNSGIDPTILSRFGRQRLKYINTNGEVDSIYVDTLFRRLTSRKSKASKAPKVSKPKKLAWDCKAFRDTFTEELNPDIDLRNLSANDTQIPLKYVNKRGKISTIRARSWFRAEKKGKRKIDPKLLCWSYPEFRDLFSRELNPDLDPEKLYIYDRRKIRYRSMEGSITSIHIKNLFYGHWEKSKLSSMHYPINYCSSTRLAQNDIIPKHATRQHRYADIIRNDKKIWIYYGKDKSEAEILKLIMNMKHNNSQLPMMCPSGHSFKMSIKTFYKYYDEPCPYCAERHRKNPDKNSAAAVDPDLLQFLADDRYDLRYISPYSGTPSIQFCCPYCGHRFKRTPKNIVGKHPKCSVCGDTGIPKKEIDVFMPDGIPFISRESVKKRTGCEVTRPVLYFVKKTYDKLHYIIASGF